MAKQLQVSQVPIREALLKLENLGLVVRVPDRGNTVTKLSRVEMHELMSVRSHLEDMAFRLAAPHVNKTAERELRKIIRRMEDAIEADDYYELSDADLAFHRAVWKLSGNQVLETVLDRLFVSIYAFVSIQRHAAKESLRKSVNHHFDLLTSFLKGDPKRSRLPSRNTSIPINQFRPAWIRRGNYRAAQRIGVDSALSKSDKASNGCNYSIFANERLWRFRSHVGLPNWDPKCYKASLDRPEHLDQIAPCLSIGECVTRLFALVRTIRSIDTPVER